MLVIGARTSSNSVRLVEVALRAGAAATAAALKAEAAATGPEWALVFAAAMSGRGQLAPAAAQVEAAAFAAMPEVSRVVGNAEKLDAAALLGGEGSAK